MYQNFYRLREAPFSLLPDPDYLYLSREHSTALSVLEYGLHAAAPFTVITGAVGYGKTTLLRYVLGRLGSETAVGELPSTMGLEGDLMRWVAYAFGVDHRQPDRVDLHARVTDCLVQRHAAGGRSLLVVDEAQNLTPPGLEELRLVSNLNADRDQRLHIVLIGQPALQATLQRPELAQLAQRVGAYYELGPLDAADTAAYVRFRLQVAGGRQDLFDGDALAQLHRLTGGVPRLINAVCHLALVYGYAERAEGVDADLVRAAGRDAPQTRLGGMPGLALAP
jgi:type II secretory pathway predicted ATPase ExeA